jgi:hypothetical protein
MRWIGVANREQKRLVRFGVIQRHGNQAAEPGLLLIGEDSLLARLQMGINHALISRLGFPLALTRLELAQSREYVSARLRAVGVHSNPFEDQGALAR